MLDLDFVGIVSTFLLLNNSLKMYFLFFTGTTSVRERIHEAPINGHRQASRSTSGSKTILISRRGVKMLTLEKLSILSISIPSERR